MLLAHAAVGKPAKAASTALFACKAITKQHDPGDNACRALYENSQTCLNDATGKASSNEGGLALARSHSCAAEAGTGVGSDWCEATREHAGLPTLENEKEVANVRML